MRNTQYLVAVALLSASVLAGGSPEQPANKNTPARAQREQDADARVHKTPAQVEGALKATVARGDNDDTAANFAEAHARAGGAAARALEAPANAAQVTNLPKLGALAVGRRQLSTYTEFPVGLFSTQIEAASWPNAYTFVTESDCFIAACCASGWSGFKTCAATSPKGRTHNNDLTISGTASDKVLRVVQSGTDEAVQVQMPLELNGISFGLKYKWKGNRGNPYYHFSPWLTSSLVYDEDGQRITDDDRASLPYMQFVYDQWHKTNGRYCTQSRVDGLVIRAPGVSDVDKEMVCDVSNHLDAIEFGVWFETEQFWTRASDEVSMTYTARSRKVGESSWNEKTITFPTEYEGVTVRAFMLSLSNWWTGHWAELADITILDGTEKAARPSGVDRGPQSSLDAPRGRRPAPRNDDGAGIFSPSRLPPQPDVAQRAEAAAFEELRAERRREATLRRLVDAEANAQAQREEEERLWRADAARRPATPEGWTPPADGGESDGWSD